MPCCEMCGKENKGCRAAVIEGVKMMLCFDCIKHAESIQPIQKPKQTSPTLPYHHSPTKNYTKKDVFQKMEKELISNWSECIKEARKKKGLSREELGFRVGERTVIIQKLENGDLRPSDKMVKKLEKELGITLLEELKKVSAQEQQTPSFSNRMTLGDFIRTED